MQYKVFVIIEVQADKEDNIEPIWQIKPHDYTKRKEKKNGIQM